jgi:hypothetical protein
MLKKFNETPKICSILHAKFPTNQNYINLEHEASLLHIVSKLRQRLLGGAQFLIMQVTSLSTSGPDTINTFSEKQINTHQVASSQNSLMLHIDQLVQNGESIEPT